MAERMFEAEEFKSSVEKSKREIEGEIEMELEKKIDELVQDEAIPAPQLHLVTGGKGPPGYNWLSELSENTIFLCRPYKHIKKDRGPLLDQYHVSHQGKHSTLLYSNLNQEYYYPVDPWEFCQHNELVEILIPGELLERK